MKFKILLTDGHMQYVESAKNYLTLQNDVERVDVIDEVTEIRGMLDGDAYDYIISHAACNDNNCFMLLGYISQHLAGKHTRLICVCDEGDEMAMHYASGMGASISMMQPFDNDALYAQMHNLNLPSYVDYSAKLDRKVSHVLLAIGIPPQVAGYKFLRFSVRLVYENPELTGAITKKLYPMVASAYNTTPSRVERAIRHAIGLSCNSEKLSNINEICGCTMYKRYEKPTNGELIALIAEHFRLESSEYIS